MALNEQMQQMIQQDIQDAETRPKEEILKEQMEGLKTVGRTARDIAVESIPGVSESLAEKRIDEAMQRGDTTGAMIEGAAGLMGVVPMVGDAAAKGLRGVAKSFRKKDIDEAEKLVDNAEKLQEWRDANRLPESQRQKNIPEAQQAAEDLFQGNITSKESRKRIKEVFPEPQLYTAETMPEMPTITDVVGSMGKKAEKGILGVKGFDLEPGQRVGARLDIPAYNEYDKWVVSIHDGKIRNGSVVGYGQAIRLKNIEFGSDPEVALDIAKGKRVAKKSGEEKPMGKATIARVFGDYVPEDPYELQEFAKKVLADKNSNWTQVGMNPYRGSYFYNKETGNVVTRADEVIQVGPLVLAKNVTEPKLSELKELFSQKTARTKDGKIRVFNEGGVVPMKRMAEQMELFEPVERGFDEGGLMEEGGMVDEESGNEVPPGSLREEVRDDIPAQLSEGEFVFPADVVRYIGLEKLMMMRQEAKQGLAQMEAMGQMGNGEEAVVEDDLPFDMYDLDVEDEEEYNSETRNYQVGGYVAPNIPYNQPNQVNPQTGTYTLPGTGIAGYQMPTGGTPTGYIPYGGAQPYFQPVQFTGPQYQTSLQTTNLPTFAETVGNKPGQYDELRTYVNDAGQTLQIPFKNGQPIYPIPEGYRPQGEEATTPKVEPTTETNVQTRGDGGGGDDGRNDVTTMSVGTAKVPSFLEGMFGKTEQPAGSPSDKFFNVTPTDAFAGNAQFGTKSSELAKASAAQGMYQMSLIGVGGISSALAKEFGLMDYNMKDMAVAGQTGKMNALNALGYHDAQQLSSLQQADLVGKAMSAAHAAAKAGQDPNKAIQDVLNSPSATTAKVEALNNLRDQLAPNGSYADVASIANQLSETYKSQLDNLLSGGFDNEIGGKGVVTDKSGKPVQGKDGPVLTGAGKALKDQLEAKIGRTTAAGNLAGSDFAGSAAAYNENVKAGTDFATSFGAFRGSSEDDDNDSGSSNDGPSNDNSSNESGSGGGMGGGYGSEDDGWGGGD